MKGIFSPDELISLEEAGIVSINLSNTAVGEEDEYGNNLISTGETVMVRYAAKSASSWNII